MHRRISEVDCYGEWREDSNADCVFDNEWFDGIWAEGAESWEKAVEIVSAYAKRNGVVLLEMTAC